MGVQIQLGVNTTACLRQYTTFGVDQNHADAGQPLGQDFERLAHAVAKRAITQQGIGGRGWGARTFFCPLALLSVVLRGHRGQWLQGSGEHGGSAQASDAQGERRKTRERCAYRDTASGVSSSELAAPPPPPSSAITSWVGRLELFQSLQILVWTSKWKCRAGLSASGGQQRVVVSRSTSVCTECSQAGTRRAAGVIGTTAPALSVAVKPTPQTKTNVASPKMWFLSAHSKKKIVFFDLFLVRLWETCLATGAAQEPWGVTADSAPLENSVQ
jgi:hypothetical protein